MDSKIEYEGEIWIAGKELKANRTQLMNLIGYISDEKNYFQVYSIYDNVEILGKYYDFFDFDLFYEKLSIMEVNAFHRLCDLSRGEYIRFQLAFAITHQTKLFLIDEATAGMDPIFRKEFYREIQHLLINEDCSVLMTTHIEEEVETKMDFVGILDSGRLKSYQTIGDGSVLSDF